MNTTSLSSLDSTVLMETTLIYILLGLLLSFHLFMTMKKKKMRCSAPQAGGAWPIIGHMHLLTGRKLLHKTLSAMDDKYGPVFSIKLGSNTALVVSSWEAAKECLATHAKVFSTRPATAASKLLGYDYAMFGAAPYGPYWREIRKIATIELLSNHRLDTLKHIRVSEVATAIRQLYTTCLSNDVEGKPVLVDMKQWFSNLTLNVSMRMVVGKRIYGDEGMEAKRRQKLMRDFFDLFGVFVLSDLIPFLGWWDFRGYRKKMKKTARELDVVVGNWLEEHKERRRVLGVERKGDEDFMDVMLTTLKDAQISGFEADTINKATCLNLLSGGSDTTMVALTWALSLLLNNRHALKKVQDELDIHVGKHRHVDESDLKNLAYLQATIKETLRVYPTVSVLAFHSAMEACTLTGGHHVQAGTRLILNIWKIHHDQRLWSDPFEFRPERFLSGGSHYDTDVRGQSFEFIPFGSGRRVCPGISMAMQVMQLALASLLHCFDVAVPDGEAVDMTESDGMTNLKATPLEVLLAPRLDVKLYK